MTIIVAVILTIRQLADKIQKQSKKLLNFNLKF